MRRIIPADIWQQIKTAHASGLGAAHTPVSSFGAAQPIHHAAEHGNATRPNHTVQRTHVYEVRPRKDKRGVDLMSDALSFGRLWYGEANAVSNAVGYALHCSRSHHAVIRIYDEAGNVIETHGHANRLRLGF